jgi:hypothetical protein
LEFDFEQELIHQSRILSESDHVVLARKYIELMERHAREIFRPALSNKQDKKQL